MIQLRPHRCARKAPAAMRRRTVDADTPRYAAASRTENSGLGKNSMRLLVVLCDFDMGPTPSAPSVCILATPCATCASSAAPVQPGGDQQAEPDVHSPAVSHGRGGAAASTCGKRLA